MPSGIAAMLKAVLLSKADRQRRLSARSELKALPSGIRIVSRPLWMIVPTSFQ
jgi:hypothetical protein